MSAVGYASLKASASVGASMISTPGRDRLAGGAMRWEEDYG